jgi:hypothetical protein
MKVVPSVCACSGGRRGFAGRGRDRPTIPPSEAAATAEALARAVQEQLAARYVHRMDERGELQQTLY